MGEKEGIAIAPVYPSLAEAPRGFAGPLRILG